MATKSILKSVNIKDQQLGKNLVHALEQASNKSAKDVRLQKSCSQMSAEEIRKTFRK